jgi:TonB family protein
MAARRRVRVLTYKENAVSDSFDSENRWIWFMLIASVGVHGALGVAGSLAVSRIELDQSKKGVTTVSVFLIAPEEDLTEPAPLEPIPQIADLRRPTVAPENVLTRNEPSFEPTPYLRSEIDRAAHSDQAPVVKTPDAKPLERHKQNVAKPPAVEQIVVEPNADRTHLSEASSGSQNATLSFGVRVEPQYPRELWLARVTGDVELIVTIGSDGRVAEAKVYKTSGYAAFDESALAAVRQWRARPLSVNSQDIIVPFSFRIRR